MENPSKMDDLRVPPFQETPKWWFHQNDNFSPAQRWDSTGTGVLQYGLRFTAIQRRILKQQTWGYVI